MIADPTAPVGPVVIARTALDELGALFESEGRGNMGRAPSLELLGMAQVIDGQLIVLEPVRSTVRVLFSAAPLTWITVCTDDGPVTISLCGGEEFCVEAVQSMDGTVRLERFGHEEYFERLITSTRLGEHLATHDGESDAEPQAPPTLESAPRAVVSCAVMVTMDSGEIVGGEVVWEDWGDGGLVELLPDPPTSDVPALVRVPTTGGAILDELLSYLP